MKIAVSILSSNYSEEETIAKINETDAEYIHVDVMDGHFVMESTPVYEYLHTSKKPLNVHLMVASPFNYISTYSVLNTESITIPCEIEDDIASLLQYIKSRGIKCGLAVNPETSLDRLDEFYDIIDEVLIMSVKPGKGGQKLMEEVLPKISTLKDIRFNHGYTFQIFVDGGVNSETIHKIKDADAVVSGSYICKSEDYQDSIDKLRL